MAKQIIVTQNNYGILLETQFIDDAKNPVDLTGYSVSVEFEYQEKCFDVLYATIINAEEGRVGVILEQKHTAEIGLYKTQWSVVNYDKNVTAQEDIYYFVKKEVSSDEEEKEENGVNAESIIDKFKDLDETLLEHSEELNMIKSTSINILYYGIVADGETDQSSKMQNIINGLAFDNTPKTICIPQGCKLKADFVIDKPYVTLTGGGMIKGKVTIDVRNSYANVVVDNIFFYETGHIEINTLRGGVIRNCLFKDNDKSIILQAIEGQTGQSIARIKIENNQFEGANYFIYAGRTTEKLSIADLHFKNNMCKWAKVSHLDFRTLDGFIVEGNTFFCTRWIKTYHHLIIRDWSNWLIVKANNFFESGHESILLTNSDNFNISGNNFAWCGRWKRVGAIKVTTTDSTRDCYGNITSNNIPIPSNTGVEIDKCRYINITDNNITLTKFQSGYCGTGDVNEDKFFGVYIAQEDLRGIRVNNNLNLINRQFNANSRMEPENRFMYDEITTSTTELNGNFDQIRIYANNTFQKMTRGYEGQEVTVYSYADFVKLIHIYDNNATGNFHLKGGYPVVLNKKDSIRFMYKDGQWIEVSRSIANECQHTTQNGVTELTLENNEDIIVLSNTTETTISNITGGYNGKEVTLIGGSASNKIEHSTLMKVKEGTTILIKNGRSITFKYFNGTWYEIGRSF